MSSVYTFRVDMVVQVLAENAEQAREQLDQHGGYMSERNVELLNTTEIAGGQA